MTQETTPTAPDPRLDEWEKLANAATPGPWRVGENDKNDQAIVRTEHLELFTGWHHCVGAIEEEMHANAAFIAAAREAIPALIAMVRERDARESDTLDLLGDVDDGFMKAAQRAEARATAAEADAAAARKRVRELEAALEDAEGYMADSSEFRDTPAHHGVLAALGRAET
jgi:hypothetical protein